MSQVMVLRTAAQTMKGNGMSVSMISRALGITEDQVKYLVRRE